MHPTNRYATVFLEVAMADNVGSKVSYFLVGLGVGAMQSEHLKPKQFHMFYGFVAIIAIAILYSYRAQLRHRLYLLYGFGGLFIMGLGIRAMIVGAS